MRRLPALADEISLPFLRLCPRELFAAHETVARPSFKAAGKTRRDAYYYALTGSISVGQPVGRNSRRSSSPWHDFVRALIIKRAGSHNPLPFPDSSRSLGSLRPEWDGCEREVSLFQRNFAAERNASH